MLKACCAVAETTGQGKWGCAVAETAGLLKGCRVGYPFKINIELSKKTLHGAFSAPPTTANWPF